MVKQRKGISPVVATALLLVVAVVAVVAFQTWFNNFQSGQLSDVEQQANAGSAITIERFEADGDLYVKNSDVNDIPVSSVSVSYAVNGTGIAGCTGAFTAIADNVTPTSLGCNVTNNLAYTIAVITDGGVYQSELLAR